MQIIVSFVSKLPTNMKSFVARTINSKPRVFLHPNLYVHQYHCAFESGTSRAISKSATPVVITPKHARSDAQPQSHNLKLQS